MKSNRSLQAFITITILSFFVGCSSVGPAKNQISETENFQLRYPVILVHGIVAYDKKGNVDDWGRIPEVLMEQGVDLYFGNTEGLGTYESNAAILKDRIEEILLKTNKEKVNIISHSKGGLDARYLIRKYNLGDKVASLTMISTPHHGWEFADLLYKKNISHSKFGKNALKAFGKLYGNKKEDIDDMIYQLTSENMIAFNELVLPDKNVFYQTFYSTLKNAFDDPKYLYTFPYIKSISGRNDGIISEKSARWGDNCSEIEGGFSHDEIIDVKRKKISGIDIPLIYLNIVKELSSKGF